MKMWAELAENDEDFKEKFNKVFNNPDVNGADNGITSDSYDQHVNMELILDRGGDRPEFTRFKK